MQWNQSEEISSKGSAEEFPLYDSGLDNKENIQDLSFYESNNPTTSLEIDHDINTQDSGYEGGKFYQFAQSLGVTPQTCWSGKRTFGSLESFEEEFMDLEQVNVDRKLPTDFNALICGKLEHGSDLNELTPNTHQSRPTKRAKSELSTLGLERSSSISSESIKFAIQKSSTEPDLIGDFTKSYCLPFASGQHQDLKCITPNTLANVMKGNYTVLDSYKIIDCRFPYEFDGGHIQGAVNLYTKDQIVNLLNEDVPEGFCNILFFHCEFSSERGPNLCRYLRNLDRIRNKDAYPKLNYPEMYVLQGGYKKFYEEFGDLCVPKAYKPMLHPEHQDDLRYFKGKSKSCSETRLQPSNRGKCKRLGFL